MDSSSARSEESTSRPVDLCRKLKESYSCDLDDLRGSANQAQGTSIGAVTGQMGPACEHFLCARSGNIIVATERDLRDGLIAIDLEFSLEVHKPKIVVADTTALTLEV